MSNLYLRKATLVVGGQSGTLDLSGMQFKFSTLRGDIQTPNTCKIRVYNLAKKTVNRLKAGEFTSIVLQGGYDSNFGIIFQGTITYIYRGNESAVDSHVDIVAADGDEAYNFAVVNRTLAAGSQPQDHIAIAAQALAEYDVQFDTSTNPTIAGSNGLPRGKVFYGLARNVLRKTCRDCGATWSIQDGNLNLVLQTSYRPGDPIVLTSATGLIGFPQQTQNGIEMRSLLNPAIKIGGQVKIDNASVQLFQFDLSIPGQRDAALVPSLDNDGLYKVLFATHTGDTRGNDFYTNLICISIDPSKAGAAQALAISRLTPGPVPAAPINAYLGP